MRGPITLADLIAVAVARVEARLAAGSAGGGVFHASTVPRPSRAVSRKLSNRDRKSK
jgi:hypothetical protein